MCPNSGDGSHNYQLKTYVVDGRPVVVKVCILCGGEA